MFDGLFTKSLKPKIYVTDRIARKFSERNAEKFIPDDPKKVKPYNDIIFESMYEKELMFTNFICDKIPSNIKIRLTELGEDLNIIRDYDLEPVTFNDDRIANIFSLYIAGFNTDELTKDEIMKVSLNNAFGERKGVRVYLRMNMEVIELLLIDPFHLVIPSRYQIKKRKKMKSYTAEEMKKRTFLENQNNSVCISELFNVIKDQDPVV